MHRELGPGDRVDQFGDSTALMFVRGEMHGDIVQSHDTSPDFIAL